MIREAELTSNHLYPTTDGKAVAETDYHRQLMFDLIAQLGRYFADDPETYVSGNLLLFYDPSNKRKHISPDTFVVFGVPKKDRLNYLTWEEGKAPDVVFELTSKSTRAEDTRKKMALYRDVLKVKEYFLFDPLEDYLEPSMLGHRLRAGQYLPIAPKAGRLPSQLLGLHLERDGRELRLWDPETESWLPTPNELALRAMEAEEKLELEREKTEDLSRENARLRELLARRG